MNERDLLMVVLLGLWVVVPPGLCALLVRVGRQRAEFFQTGTAPSLTDQGGRSDSLARERRGLGSQHPSH